ncbi:hypothetical protein EHQ53_15875 [Leptospira langatensis]|uniref:DinB family protein n=1 Tax=Leptospira langatensis TaxID=2484983 RepID=A0A5F1ZQF5_9LEPT|nr:hypothetical protein [Leptospira langatensis]TGK05124.1 hypothetical protein EHO57_00115 [Leptospira langatensis]TGL38260.1 hypothetical protein EHQ53_15875 [Leptospira langatensis]
MIQTRPVLLQSITGLFYRLSELLDRVSEENYVRPLELLSGASVGKQVRHCVEVAEALLSGWENGLVSYDRRERNPLYESSPRATSSRILELISELESRHWGGPVQVSHILDPSSGEEEILESSWERELLYVQEHTIHHEAIIRVALENGLGFYDIPADFGFAISTLHYNLSQSYFSWDPVI